MKRKGLTMDRRSLVEGLTSPSDVDPQLEQNFVYNGQPKADPGTPHPGTAGEGRDGKGTPAGAVSRVPLTTRVRSDFAAALKRASLQRQLDGELPNTLQDILEEALEPWLRSHHYLD